ncbi:MAG TPA: M56 family metallopeptidase [Candidatus Acidoferrum sp.]|nr:M56 family metallopeptidase [Candidatus Acidoferrum sp.]
MTPLLEFLRASAPSALQRFAWPILWQSSLLIGVLFLLDSLLRRRLRPAIRYTLWLLLLVKLLLPPSLALPTSLAWWLRPSAAPTTTTQSRFLVVTYGPPTATGLSASPAAALLPPPPLPFPISAWAVLVSTGVSVALLGVMLVRWRQVSRMASEALSAPASLERLLGEASSRTEVCRRVRLKLTVHPMSPAVCGFFRPVILLPRSLAESLPASQLRAVLLHELIHLRRKDVWINAVQAMLLVAYWWHPLLWLANARIRRLREQAVDDAVMLALRDESETYAPTLLEVAKLDLARPLSSLGLVGIFESKTALRERILRLDEFRPGRKAGLTLFSGLGVVAFALTALPMGNGPAQPATSASSPPTDENPWPDSRFSGYSNIQLQARFFIVDETGLRGVVPVTGNYFGILNSNELAALEGQLQQAGAGEVPMTGQVQFQSFSGGHFSWIIGGQVNNEVRYQTRTVGSGTIVTGAEAQFIAPQSGWVPLELQVVPWVGDQSLRCQVALEPAFSSLPPRWSEVPLPAGGALFWVRTGGMSPGMCQIVVLHNSQNQPGEPPNLPVVRTWPSVREEGTVPFSPARSEGLVQEGKLLFELGKLSEAETKLNRAIEEDPKQQAAYYYLNLITEAREKERRSKDEEPVRPQHPFLVWTNSVHTSPGHYGINRKLDSIRFENISFDHLPLREVLAKLNDEVKRLDPEEHGINFIINNNTAPGAAAGVVDPSTGSPVPAAPPQALADIGQVPITILHALTDVRAADVLDAVVAVAPLRIKYEIEDYGVVFSEKRKNEPSPLYVRIIKVDPDRFSNGRAFAADAHSPPRDPKDLNRAVHDLFAKLGVTLEPPKSVFFNDRDDTLVVRATQQDLAAIETIVQELKLPGPQIRIRAKFFEVPQALDDALPFANLPKSDAQVTKILTAAQTSVLRKALDSNTNCNLLGEAAITTLSGRQAQIQILPDPAPKAAPNPNALDVLSAPAAPPNQPGTGSSVPPASLSLNVVAYASADGQRLQLSGSVSVPVLTGYDPPVPHKTDIRMLGGDAVLVEAAPTPYAISGSLPLPHFRIRECPFTAVIPDPNDQTLLIGSSGEPALELPRFPAISGMRRVVILLTPTILDKSGTVVDGESEHP